jgi:hypothetical protein
VSEEPKADRASWAPGEIVYGDGDIAINAGAQRLEMAVVNTDDRPVQVGSHVHLPQANAALQFAAGRIRQRERVQIGRSDERQGFWSGSLHADVDGAPLLRHRIELGNGSVADDALGTPMACISEFHYPDIEVATEGVALALTGGGCLSTWQGDRL